MAVGEVMLDIATQESFKSTQSRKMANEGSEGDLEVEKPPSL